MHLFLCATICYVLRYCCLLQFKHLLHTSHSQYFIYIRTSPYCHYSFLYVPHTPPLPAVSILLIPYFHLHTCITIYSPAPYLCHYYTPALMIYTSVVYLSYGYYYYPISMPLFHTCNTPYTPANTCNTTIHRFHTYYNHHLVTICTPAVTITYALASYTSAASLYTTQVVIVLTPPFFHYLHTCFHHL